MPALSSRDELPSYPAISEAQIDLFPSRDIVSNSMDHLATRICRLGRSIGSASIIAFADAFVKRDWLSEDKDSLCVQSMDLLSKSPLT